MKREFAKLHGLGNDFVFFDGMDGNIELGTEEVQHLCDRHFGIGADGIIVVRPPKTEGAAGYMHYINSDGTLAQMCGNGVRCFAKYLVDHGYADSAAGSLVADTMAGPKPLTFAVDEQGKMVSATVDMGCPILDSARVPTALSPNATSANGEAYVREAVVSSPWGDFSFTCVSMGNPHAVCFIDDWESVSDDLFSNPCDKRLETLDVAKVGAYYESHAAFPEKTNVEFAVAAADGIHMRVYERGCAETLACGTGACATNVAAVLTGRCGASNDLHLLGGMLHIEWRADGHVLMTGPAEQSFTGVVDVQ